MNNPGSSLGGVSVTQIAAVPNGNGEVALAANRALLIYGPRVSGKTTVSETLATRPLKVDMVRRRIALHLDPAMAQGKAYRDWKVWRDDLLTRDRCQEAFRVVIAEELRDRSVPLELVCEGTFLGIGEWQREFCDALVAVLGPFEFKRFYFRAPTGTLVANLASRHLLQPRDEDISPASFQRLRLEDELLAREALEIPDTEVVSSMQSLIRSACRFLDKR